MKINRLNRVELLLPAERIDSAIAAFSALLGIAMEPARLLADVQVKSSVCWEAGIEIFGPGGPDSVLHALLEVRGREGAIGPVVWEVENIDDARAHLQGQGFGIQYEFVHENGSRQLSLDAADCFGYTLTFLEQPAGPPQPVPGSKARFKRLNRVELLLPAQDLQPAVDLFSRLLNVRIAPLEYMPEHHVLTTTCWEAGFELFGPGDAESSLLPLLEQRGQPGTVGPIVWEVEDIARMREHALSLGHQVVYEFDQGGRRQFYLGAGTLFGYTVTFLQYLA